MSIEILGYSGGISLGSFLDVLTATHEGTNNARRNIFLSLMASFSSPTKNVYSVSLLWWNFSLVVAIYMKLGNIAKDSGPFDIHRLVACFECIYWSQLRSAGFIPLVTDEKTRNFAQAKWRGFVAARAYTRFLIARRKARLAEQR